MAAILTNLTRAVITAFVLAAGVIVIAYYTRGFDADMEFAKFIFRWLHVLSGVMWIGLLWYFNFVQIPNMPKIPAEHKPAITKVIAPAALFWFRWSAMATLITGLVLAHLNGYMHDAVLLGTVDGSATLIGIGMWLGFIMWFNVWFIIWPNQKKALGITPVDADATAKAARFAMLTSRTNMVLSVPMLFCMVAQMHLA